MNFLQYVLQEVKDRRLSHPDALEIVRQYHEGTEGAARSSAEDLHPLLQRNTSTLSEQRFSTTFTGHEFFLADHVVQGVKVLPGAVHLEMARAAVAQAAELAPGGDRISLRDVVFASPVVVGQDALTVHIALEVRDDGTIGFEIFSDGADAPVLHSQGRAVVEAAAEAPAVSTPGLTAERVWDAASCYEAFGRMGLAYGPSHRPLLSARAGRDAQGRAVAIGRLALPEALQGERERFFLHPSLLDGALQAVIGLVFDETVGQSPKAMLPFAIGELQMYAPLPAAAEVIVRPGADNLRDGATRQLDLDIVDAAGRLAVRIKGFSIRALEGMPVQVAARHSEAEDAPERVGELTLVPVWDVAAAISGETWPVADQGVVILAEDRALMNGLLGRYPHAAECLLDPAASVEQLAEQLRALGTLSHVFWIVAPARQADPECSEVIAAQGRGVLVGFRIVKALLSLGCGRTALGLTVITTQSQSVAPREPISPAHASVQGLVGSLAKEFPNWRVRLADLPEAEAWPLAELLTLPADANGDACLFRHGQWYRPRLVSCTLPEPEQPVYRRNGVYVILGGAGGIGEAFSEYLVRDFQAQVVWIGRRPEDAAIARKLERIAACGVRPLYMSADATDSVALAAAYRQIKAQCGEIHGVVHAMLVLADQSVARMDEGRFVAALAPKVDASVNLVRVFGQESLDFVLFFSSLQSVTKSAGQGNYAAGCTFTDAYAQAIGSAFPWRVKVVNWGYWGSVGIVASEEYRSRMRRAGIDSIEPPEAFALLNRLLCAPQGQAIFLKTNREEAAAGLGIVRGEVLQVLPPASQPLADLPESTRQALPMDRERFAADTQESERCSAGLLFARLSETGLFGSLPAELQALQARLKLPAMYARWLARSMDVLVEHGFLARQGNAWALPESGAPAVPELLQAWERHKADYLDAPERQAHIRLVDAAMQALPSILAGETPATAVLFPNSSVSAVEGIYKRNPIADYFNEVLAEVLLAEIERRLRRDPGAKFRLFEIGAGTGGTSALLFERLAPFAAQIEEYCYSDVSKVFLLHAQDNYASKAPYLRTRIFNVEQPPAAQGVELANYDFVVATNVLHATKDMRQTMRNTKALLRQGGLLLVNEIASFNLFTHLTFGLLEGWWLHTDSELRITGSPALAPETWRFLLGSEGYSPVSFPAKEAHGFVQQIIAARSDGVIRRTTASVPLSAGRHEKTARLGSGEMPPAPPAAPADAGELERRLQAALAATVSAQLKIRAADIDGDTSLNELGFDSITLTAFTNTLNSRYGLDLTPTVLFEHSTLAGLARHLAAHHQMALQPYFGVAAPISGQATASSAAAVEPRELEGLVLAVLAAMASAQLKLRPEDIDGDTSLNELGFDSITLTAFANTLNSRFGLELTPTVLFERPTLAGLANYLVAEHLAAVQPHFGVTAQPAYRSAPVVPAMPAVPPAPLRKRRGRAVLPAVDAAARAPSRAPDPVAIIGVSGRFPQASDLDELWANLAAGRDCIREIPDTRWDWSTLYGDPTAGGSHSNVKHAGVIDGIDEFDPQFFGISPREAETMDPQQRLLMMYVWKAIEDAGYAPQRLSGSRTALLIGTASSGYSQLLEQAGQVIEGYSSTSAVASVGPNRMSFLLNLHGPSEPIETACSSALVAIHRAVELLQSGQCELVIAGGVNSLISPAAHISFNKAGMLSSDGRCKTFSDQANGYVRGEGVGMLVLKSLAAAERDGDRIYAVIRGTAENHGGKANSLTAPNPRAQADLIKAAITQAGVDPATISYIEAHGTGTPLGDPVEVQGLKTAFQELAAERRQDLPAAYCGIGSIKTNVGHLEIAAGVAGVIKVLLQMQHRTLVPSLHCETVNPYIDLAGSPFYVVRESEAWQPLKDAQGRALPLRAGVSSFGFGGVNAHVVLEEYVAAEERRASMTGGPYLAVLSAKNAERLRDQVRQLLQAIEARGLGQDDLADIAYTLQVGRDAMETRLACVVGSIDELKEKLTRYLEDNPAIESLYRGDVKRHKETLAVFTADDELQEAIGKWIGRGKLGKLADLWVKGLAVDWAQLYGAAKPRRIGLPTYPFARECYWVQPGAAGGAAAKGAAMLHPLVHRNTSTLAEQRFSTTFTGKEFFLADHVVQGKPMLPGVAYLEMVRESLVQANAFDAAGTASGVNLRLKNVVWVKPVIVAGGPADVHVDLYAESDGRVAYEVHSGGDDLHCQGWAEPLAARSEQIDLTAWRAQCEHSVLSGDACYAGFDRLGLNYGPAFRAIERIHVGVDRALARLQLPTATAPSAAGFVLHPGLLDAALQATAGLAEHRDRPQLVLPFGVESVDIVGGCQPQMWALVQPAGGGSADGRVRKYDVTLCDDHGVVCVRLRGFTSRIVESRLDASGVMLLQPEWREQAAADGALPDYQYRHVALAGVGVEASEVQPRLDGVHCVELPGDYERAVQQLCAELQRLLQGKHERLALLQVVVPAAGPRQILVGLAGVLRSARLEQPKLVVQLIAVNEAEDAAGLAAKLAENARCPQDIDIRYAVRGDGGTGGAADGGTGGKAASVRQVAHWRELTEEPSALLPWRADGVYLITGGLGGLGLLFAREIAERAPGVTLILVGRRALDDARRQHLRALEALGATIEYRAVDVADQAAVRQLVLQVQEDHQALHGIIHAAGVVRDSLLLKKTDADIDAVLAPKVAGVLHLDEASCDIELDWFICFSSTSAALGNVGQADYAAANGFLDAFAHYRNDLVSQGRRHGRTVSVNWSLWQEGGMQVDAATLQALAATGLQPLPTTDGLQAFYQVLGAGGAQAMVLHGLPGKIRQRLLAPSAGAGATATVVNEPTAVAAKTAAEGMAEGVAAADVGRLQDKLGRMLTSAVSTELKIKPDDIDREVSLSEMGFDSITLTTFANALNTRYGLDLTPTVLFEHSTLAGLARYLATEHQAALLPHFGSAAPQNGPSPAATVVSAPQVRGRRRGRTAPAVESSGRLPGGAAPAVAIIGVSGRFPQASDLEELWANLAEGRDCIGEIPDSRWDWRQLADDPAAGASHGPIKRAGVIDGIDEFDPQFFGISPREAETMDPQQRLLMMYVWTAIEDAGYAPQRLSGSKTALLIGTGASGYANLLRQAGESIEAYSSTSAVASVGPNRMSFLLNLHGPSEPIETACSSALVAIHRAVELLQSGQCELAVAGGVSTLLSPEMHISFSKAGMLSPDGRCKTFSDQANGYVRGEGVGMLVLKPLAAAERDGDQIYAVVRGTAENHGGKANSLTAPNPRAQADLIKAAIGQAGVDPATISYIEAHGTGTPLGDPVEVQGLKTAFQELAAARGQELPAAYCGLGSIKTNIGHLELAAGVAGVIKVLLQLRHRTLAPSLHCATINPYIDLSDSPFYVVREKQPWQPLQDAQGRVLPRRAGVSSFGFGGVNTHVVLEEYVPTGMRAASASTQRPGPFLVVLSARHAERLQDQAKQLLQAIDRQGLGQDDLADLAYTLQVGRDAMETRLACVVATLDELKEKLARYLEGATALESLYRGEVKRQKDSLAVFSADEELQETIGKWIQRGKFDQLADLWVKGLSFDWMQLYGEPKPRRISLPTYPFARERYWVPQGGAQAAAGTGSGPVLHPLLQRNTSSLAEQRFSTTFSGREFVLADHIVRGIKVLPGVAHLEMARAAACEALELGADAAVPMNLDGVVFSRPITVDQSALEFHVGVTPEADGRLQYRLYRRQEDSAEPVMHSLGTVELVEPAALVPLQHDLPILLAACGRQRISREQCYGTLAAKGLALGPSFQVVQEIHLGDRQALARLALPEHLADQAGRYVMHPSMMDAALQASAGLLIAGGEIDNRLSLPFALSRLEIHDRTTASMWSYVRFSADSQAGDQVPRLDFDLCHEDGRVCARFIGLAVRMLNEPDSKAVAAAAPETLLLQPEWQTAPVSSDDEPGGEGQQEARVAQPIPADRHLVLLSDSPVDPAALAAHSGARCEALPVDYPAQAEVVLARLQALLAAETAASAQTSPVLLQLVVPAFGPHQVAAGLGGLLMSAQLEHPQLTAQVIAVDCDVDAGQLAAKLAENSRRPQDRQSRYAEGERLVLGWSELARTEPTVPWKDGGVYLITGGLGGLGRIFAQEIAAQAKGAVLVLTGRRALEEFGDDAGRQAIRELEALGATVEYRVVDVADRDAVRRLILEVHEDHAALHGILHSAGVLRDGLLLKKTPETLRDVLAPKVAGLINLDEASRELDLDCFICFSSLSAIRGNIGQADYAAANAYMDAYAANRNSLVAMGQRRGRTLSVNWPLWQDGGMRVEPATVRAMELATGMTPLRTASGIDALYQALASELDQVAVMEGNAARLRKLLNGEPEAVVTTLRPQVQPAVAASAPVIAKPRVAPAVQPAMPVPAAAPASAPAPVAAAGPTLDGEVLLDRVKRRLTQAASRQLKLKPNEINGDAEMSTYGFDSLMLSEFISTLNQEYGFALPPTIFYEYPTLNGFARHLSERYRDALAQRFDLRPGAAPAAAAAAAAAQLPAATVAPTAMRAVMRSRFGVPAAHPGAAAVAPALPVDDPVVIVGMSGGFPMADDVDEFWSNLRAGRDCMSEVPPDRWDWREYYGDPTKEVNKTNIKWGGFISGAGHFDPLFFGISPKEADMMDPQQRLLMLHVWNCIEDAGHSPASLAGTRTAILVGTGPTGYTDLIARSKVAIEGYTITGGVPSVGPNRMSYFLDLRGPSEPVETACSSALVAMHRGVQAIDSGECDMAIVGGVNTLLSPGAQISFSKAGMLSEDGRCKTFSNKADGYARGEGVGMLMLKRQSAAERDGDHIYGIIRGTAENHGGRANSLTAPNPKAQADLIKTAFDRAGVDPRTVGYMEAHGTGTPLGDPVEVNGLKMAFRELYAATGSPEVQDAHCGIGSVKTNIGHLELAAGAAGVIKVLLQMQHKTLVPSLHCENLNPYIDLKGSPFYVVREAREWVAPQDPGGNLLPRRAGISSFGFGGVNAHVVLEEYVPKTAPLPIHVDEQNPALIVLSAKNPDRLQDRARQLRAAIERGVVTPDNLAEAAYTLQVGREAMEVRLAMVVTSVDDLVEKLDAVVAGDAAADDVYRGETKRHKQDLALFMSDEDTARMLEAWLDKGKYGKLLELWVKGLNFDWARLYPQRQPRRLRLPAYPFAKEHYWVPKPPADLQTAGTGAQASLHPLVHCNTSNLAEQRFTTRFTGHERFLADHVVHGRKMLPGVAHLEMARTALAEAVNMETAGTAGGVAVNGLHLKNVVFSRPILVEEAGLEVHVGVRPEADGDLGYELYGVDAGSGARMVYSQGSATLAPAAEVRIDLAAVQAACSRDSILAAAFYQVIRDKGLALGSGLQAIQALYVGEDQVLARLQMPAVALAERAHYLLHPSMLDAAVTSPVALVMRTAAAAGGLALPFALRALEILGECRETMWVVARLSPGSHLADKVQKFDLDLCDDEGRVCVRFKGLSVRTFDPSGGGATPETLLLQPEWRHAAAIAGTNSPAYGDWCVLLCDSPLAPAALAAQLDARCEALPDDYPAQAESVLARLQALIAAKPVAPALVQLVVPEFGVQQLAAGLAGLLKTARLEHPKLIGQVIAVDRNDDAEQLAAKLEENRRCPQDVQIRYVDGERQVLAWRELTDAPPVQPWKAGGVYLITGGLGGLGRIFAKEIAIQAPGATLVLTGRRTLDELSDDAGRPAIRELEACGARVEYHALDVADRDAARRLVLQVHEDHGALHGIVHSAGVLRDSLLVKKTPEALREVLAAKVAGLINLDEASRDIDLDWLICFSSVSAIRGNVGQADYAAANAFMDAYAAYRNSLAVIGQRHGRTLSVNWPLWQDGGMQADPATAQALEKATGLVPLRTASGIDALYRAMGSGLDQVVVMEGQAARIRQALAGDAATTVAGSVAAPTANAAGAESGDSPADQIRQILTGIVSTQARVKPEAIKGNTELHEYGFDSIMLTELGNRLNHEFQLDLAPTVFFEYPTLNDLAKHLSTRHLANFSAHLTMKASGRPAAAPEAPSLSAAPLLPAQTRLAAVNRLAVPVATTPAHGAAMANDVRVPSAGGAAEPIAIIGLSGRFPQADDVDALWENLRGGRDCVTEVPSDRWDMAAYYDPQKGRAGKSYTKWGGFIDGIDRFDALFFHISPREAHALDPQVRLFLQTVWSLFEGSGYTRESLQQLYQGRVGVYVGAMAQPSEPGGDGDVIASLPASSAIANRVSYFFNFDGPSIAIDTMCSSAMMAIHLACRDLQQGECALAVAGGVNLSLSPQKYVGMSQVQLVGSHPESRSFTDGDGHLPAETVGALLLKPLSKAVADGDTILGVIRGTATHHSGRSNGYAVPNPKAQAKVMAESLRRAGVAPDSISWIEAAAAGTALSDAIEMIALGSVFEEVHASGRKIPVGAVKSNIGHPELASGVAQVAKVILQLQHRELVPLLAIGTPNRQLRMDELPLALQREPAAWESTWGLGGERLPRRALVNSFAAGGTYVSAVIEEYLSADAPDAAKDQPQEITPEAQLFVFSARNEDRLRAVVERTLQRLECNRDVNLRDLAYTLQIGREAMDSRLAVIASTHAELRERLRVCLDGQDLNGLPLYRSPNDAPMQSPLGASEETALAALVAARDLDGLARYWVQGGTAPWGQLHAGRRVQRITWSTYPFAPTVYAIGYGTAPAKGTPGAAPQASATGGVASASASLATVVVQAVAAALGIPAPDLPLNKPLLTLGYNSIAAMELKFRLEAALQRPIGLELISDATRSIDDLSRQLAAAGLESAPRAGATDTVAVLPVLVPQPAARYEPFPLTDMQEAFLLGRRSTIDGDRIGAHIYVEIDVAGSLDIFRLNRAWNRLVARHDMLRAEFAEGGEQRILPSVRDYRFKVVDLRRLGEAERQFKADLLRESMEHHVFSGSEWPLFDIRVAIHGEGRYRIHFSIDELIVDGLSADTLVRQWDQLYANAEHALPALELTFRDYVLALKAFEGSDQYQQDLAYWLQRLEQLPGGPQFPRSVAETADVVARRRTRLSHRLPAAAWAVLKDKAATLGVSPTSLVLGVFAEVLRAWTDSPTFTLVLTYFNRPPLHPQIRELVGPAISSLLFVVEPGAGDDFAAIVQDHHRRLWQDLGHSSVSGIQALRQLRNTPGRRGRSLPAALPVVFTSMLGSDVTSEPLRHLGDVSYVVNQTPQVYLDHQLRDSAAGLDCSWDVVEGYFAPGFVQAMFDAYGKALEGLAGGRLPWTVASFVRPATAIDALDPTTAQLAGFLVEARREDPLAPFPLTDQQQAYAFGRDTRLEGGGSSCQFYQELQMERLDVARLEQALATLIARHPMLRTVVDANGSQSTLAQAPRYTVEVADLRQHEAEPRQIALAAIRHALLGRVVPLGEWPYFAVTVSQLPGETACVHLCFDLMLVDSTSIGQLLLELIRLYEQPQSVPPVPGLSFRDYQQAVERFKAMPGYTERLTYWHRKFADLPGGPALPQLSAVGAAAADEHRRIDGVLACWDALKQHAEASHVAPGLILLTAYLEVLYAWNGQVPLAVVVPGWERLPVHPDIERVAGDFTTLSWVTHGPEVLSFEDRLAQVARQHAGDLAQRPVSGLQALRRVMLRDRRRLRYPVVFTNQITPLTLPSAQFKLGEALSKTPQVYLDNLSSEAGGRLHCSWDFAGGVYAPAMVKEMFDGYLRLLELLGSDPQAWRRTAFSDLLRARPAAYVTAGLAVAR